MKLPNDIAHSYPQMTSLYYDPTVRGSHSTEDQSFVKYRLKDEVHRALEEISELRVIVEYQSELVLELQDQIRELESELAEANKSSRLLSETLRESADGDNL